MKLARAFSRLSLLSLAAAVFAALTGLYGASLRPNLPDARWQAARWHRPPKPQIRYLPEFFGQFLVFALFTVAGRVFRLRLSLVPRGQRQVISLNRAVRQQNSRFPSP